MVRPSARAVPPPSNAELVPSRGRAPGPAQVPVGGPFGTLARPPSEGSAIGPSARTTGSTLRVIAWVIAAAIALSARVALADVGTGTPSDAVLDPAASAPAGRSPKVVVPPEVLDPARAPSSTVPGIDVSHYQGEIDWAAVAGSGVRFAIAKATEGRNYVDPTYLTNKAGAELNGVIFGAYHFARPDATTNDAVSEADRFVDAAQLEAGNLIPVLDLERTGGLSQGELTAWILAWLDRVTERVGVRPMIYTSPHGWDVRTGDTTAIVDAGYTVLWVAHWGTDSPTVPAGGWGGFGWTFWQYGNCGSIPGIAGCVDVDAYAGTTFDGVTLPSPDLVPPTVTMSTPVGGPVTVSFDEVVHQVTADNMYVWTPGTGTYPAIRLTCRSGRGVVVECLTGSVRSVVIETVEPLVPGESYEAVVNPGLVPAAVEDRAGNAAPTTMQSFLAPTAVDDDDPAVRYAWRGVNKAAALGGSFLEERSAGASASFAFGGRSVTWYTVSGRDQGLATVRIDGEKVGTFDQYADRPAFAVPRRFTGLARGNHVITVRVLGRASARARDTQIAVDAFGVEGHVTRDPRLELTWARTDAMAHSEVARSSLELTFHGTGIDWMTREGPDQGHAAIYVDGLLVREVDGYASTEQDGIVRSVTGLATGTHILRIVVLGESRAAATGAFVSIDGFTVAP